MGSAVVSEYVAFHYKAFISYSNSDRAWAERVQSTLEAFPIDAALRGFPTRVGAVPESLRPIFRDRSHLVAAGSLTKELRSKLQASPFLIVICSPAAAASTYVNDEIRYFRGLGRDDRILSLIVDGAPGDPISNCFPPALFERLPGSDETEHPGQPVAPDARKEGDGWANARLKLIGGLLGLPLDIILRNQRYRLTKERYLWSGAVAALASIAVFVGLNALQLSGAAERDRQVIEGSIQSTSQLVKRTAHLADGSGLSASAAVEVLKGIEDLYAKYQGHDDDPKSTVRLERATMLLDFARHYTKLKQPKDQMRVVDQAFKELDRLQLPTSRQDQTGLAIVGHRATAHWLRGEASFADGRYKVALDDFLEGARVIDDGDLRFYSENMRLEAEQYVRRVRLILGKARAELRLSSKENPLESKRRALEVAKRAVDMGRDLNLDTRRDTDLEAAELLIDARYLVADLIRQLNDRKQELVAQAHVNSGLASARHLHAQNPGRTSLVQRLATLHLASGDLHRWRGDSHSAHADYKRARDLRETQYKKDPTDRSLKFSFAFNLIKVGEELTTLRRPHQAIAEFALSERLLAELREERPNDSVNRYWIWTAIQGLGYAYRQTGDLPKEIDCHHRKLVLAREHREQTPDGVDSLLVLGESYRDYGNALVARGNTAGGLENLTEAQKLLAAAASNPSPDWRFVRMQASVLESIARAKLIRRQFSDARDATEEAYQLRERDRTRIGKLDPHAQADMAENRRLIGNIQLANAQCREAKGLYEEAATILDRLVREHVMPNPEWLEKYNAARKELTAIAWSDAGPECSDGPVDRKMGDIIAMARQLPQ